MTKTNIIKKLSCLLMLVTLPLTTNAEQNIDLPPISNSSTIELPDHTTHSTIQLTPDKSELIRLDQAAASIIVGNPAHINVIADSTDTLVIIPRVPGASHFTVIGKQGQVVMQRHVIVASPKKDYVRIKRTCAAGSDNCNNTSVFYCPDICHEISLEGSQTEQVSANNGDNSASTGSQSENSSPPTPIAELDQ